MKRPTPEERLRHIRAARRELKKRQRRSQDGQIYGELLREAGEADLITHERTSRVELIGDLSLCTNPRAVLVQLASLQGLKKTNVFVDLSAVTTLDAAALLLLCSRIDLLNRVSRLRVSGSYPAAPAALAALRAAGFSKWLSGRVTDSGAPNVELRDGDAKDRLTVEVPLAIRNFLRARHTALGFEEIDRIYPAVYECLENVRNHAYSRGRFTGAVRRWLVVGWYDETRRCSSVAILDRGVGIVETVKPKLLREPLLRARFALDRDSDYLRRASKGELTDSREAHRGKGLSSLRSFVIARDNCRLHIVSSTAAITWSERQSTIPSRWDSLPNVGGTIICMELFDP